MIETCAYHTPGQFLLRHTANRYGRVHIGLDIIMLSHLRTLFDNWQPLYVTYLSWTMLVP